MALLALILKIFGVCLFVCQETLFNQGDKFSMGQFCVGGIWVNIDSDRICYGPKCPLSLRHLWRKPTLSSKCS